MRLARRRVPEGLGPGEAPERCTGMKCRRSTPLGRRFACLVASAGDSPSATRLPGLLDDRTSGLASVRASTSSGSMSTSVDTPFSSRMRWA